MATAMTAAEAFDESSLRSQIDELKEKLGDLDNDLQSIDAELAEFGDHRETYHLLESALGSLEQLETVGAGHLFWGDESPERMQKHVQAVRGRADAYLGRIGEIEQRREAVAEEIARHEGVLDLLEYDLDELRYREEQRMQEWQIERELIEPDRATIMPWGGIPEEQQRLRKTLSVSLLVALVLGVVIPMIELPLPDLDLIPEVPERFANLIERELPPPPPPTVVEETPPEEEPPEDTPPEEVVPEEPIVVEELPEEIPEEVAPASTVAEEPAPQQEVRSAGILAFRDSISNIERREPSELGAQARINDAGDAEVGRTERAMVTSQAPGSSGGINLASLSRDVGGGGGGQGLDGVQVSRVASSIGGTGGSADRPMAGSASAGRTRALPPPSASGRRWAMCSSRSS